MATRLDIHEDVTNRILAQMEQGRIPWVKDWACAGGSINRVSKRPYSGINLLILGMAGVAYANQQWLTFKQAKALGGCVRKGETGTRIVFYKKRVITDESGDERMIPVLKTFTVFNVEQCDDVEPLVVDTVDHGTETPLFDFVQAVAEQNGIDVIHGNPAYSLSSDVVSLPLLDEFETETGYAQAATHEFTHWTGAESRLGRFKEFEEASATRNEAYAREELVAELGSAFFSSYLGIPSVTTHAAYLQSWIQALRGDKKFIFRAAADANRALRLLHPAMFSVEEKEAVAC